MPFAGLEPILSSQQAPVLLLHVALQVLNHQGLQGLT